MNKLYNIVISIFIVVIAGVMAFVKLSSEETIQPVIDKIEENKEIIIEQIEKSPEVIKEQTNDILETTEKEIENKTESLINEVVETTNNMVENKTNPIIKNIDKVNEKTQETLSNGIDIIREESEPLIIDGFVEEENLETAIKQVENN